MAEESKWSNFFKSSSDSLILLRQAVILAILLILIFYPSSITNTLKNIGLAFEEAGFTEITVIGIKADLKALRQKVQDTKLNTEGTQKILTNVLESLKKIQQPDEDIKNAITEISIAKNSLESIKKELRDAIAPTAPSADQTQPVLSDSKPWVVVVGADRTPKDANYEVQKAKDKGFKDAKIIYRDDSYKWYRTVIPFETEEDAKKELLRISKEIREDSFIRDLNKWCENLESKELNSVKFEICIPRKTG
jgi:hypothetical protein